MKKKRIKMTRRRRKRTKRTKSRSTKRKQAFCTANELRLSLRLQQEIVKVHCKDWNCVATGWCMLLTSHDFSKYRQYMISFPKIFNVLQNGMNTITRWLWPSVFVTLSAPSGTYPSSFKKVSFCILLVWKSSHCSALSFQIFIFRIEPRCVRHLVHLCFEEAAFAVRLLLDFLPQSPGILQNPANIGYPSSWHDKNFLEQVLQVAPTQLYE